MHEGPETWIARPGDLILPSHAVPLSATRVGGLPTFPEGLQAPSVQLTTCRVCGKPMALLLQAHAPLTSEQTHAPQAHRYLYIYCCTAEECGKQAECWRALRAVTPSQAASHSDPPAAAAGQQEPSLNAAREATAADDWGAGGAADDWGVAGGAADDRGVGSNTDWDAVGGADAGSSQAAAAFDFGDLNAALDAVGSSAPAKAPARRGQGQQPGASGTDRKAEERGAHVYDASRPCLPAFFLHAEPESQCSAGGGSAQSWSEQERLQQLLERYQQEEAAAGSAADAAPGGDDRGAAGQAAACLPELEGGPSAWGGEGYEEDAVLAQPGARRRPGPAFLKFSQQLARCPDQCARYSFGGRPLWPDCQGSPEAAPCSSCGGPRVFELQLMSPLMPALVESRDWLAAEPQAAAAALQPADSWEWLTVCVFSCRASCCRDDEGPQFHEEEVELVNEE